MSMVNTLAPASDVADQEIAELVREMLPSTRTVDEELKEDHASLVAGIVAAAASGDRGAANWLQTRRGIGPTVATTLIARAKPYVSASRERSKATSKSEKGRPQEDHAQEVAPERPR